MSCPLDSVDAPVYRSISPSDTLNYSETGGEDLACQCKADLTTHLETAASSTVGCHSIDLDEKYKPVLKDDSLPPRADTGPSRRPSLSKRSFSGLFKSVRGPSSPKQQEDTNTSLKAIEYLDPSRVETPKGRSRLDSLFRKRAALKSKLDSSYLFVPDHTNSGRASMESNWSGIDERTLEAIHNARARKSVM